MRKLELHHYLGAAVLGVWAVKLVDPKYEHLSKYMTTNFWEGDVAEKHVGRYGYIKVDTWALTHAGLFALLSYKFPDKRWHLFGAGVVWEGLEWTAAKYNPKYWGETKEEQVHDAMLFNVSGILLGRLLAGQ